MFKNHSLNAVGRRRLQLRRQSNALLPSRPCSKSPSKSCSGPDLPAASPQPRRDLSTLTRTTTTSLQSPNTYVVQLTAAQARSGLILRRQKQLEQLQRYHSGPGLEELTSYCSPPSALLANTISSESRDLSRSQSTSMTRETSTFSECFGDTLHGPDENDSDDLGAQEDFLQQAQDTRRHDYSRPLSEFESGRSDARHDTPSGSPIPGGMKQDQEHCNRVHGPPASRTWNDQRRFDRTAVQTYLIRAIKSNGKFSNWTNEQRWSFMRDKRREKLMARESTGKGTLSSWYPREFADAGGEHIELVFLRKQMAEHLRAENVLPSRRARSPDQDEDDEEMIIKKEEHDEEKSGGFSELINSSHLYPQRDTTTRSRTKSHRPRNRGSDQEPESLCSRCQRLPAVPPENEPGGEDELFAENMHLDQIVSATVVTSDTTVPSIVGPEWRQYWETNQDGYSALITPRTWKWNDKCQLVEWPPLDQILPPLEPPPVLHVKQEKKRKRADSVATPRGGESGNSSAM